MPDYGIISPGIRESFLRNGLIVLQGAYSTRQIRQLRKRIEQMVRDYQPDPADAADASQRLRASMNSTSFFLAADTFADGQLSGAKMRSIAEIGHAMHDEDAVFSDFFRREQLLTICFMLGIKKPRLARSSCLFNRSLSDATGQQDASLLFTEPLSTIRFWIALEDAKPDQGCLQVALGGHQGPLRRRLQEADGAAQLVELDAEPLPDCDTSLLLTAGSMAVMHGLLPHFHVCNNQSFSCMATSLQVIDGENSCPADNWLQRNPDLPLRGFGPAAQKAATNGGKET